MSPNWGYPYANSTYNNYVSNCTVTTSYTNAVWLNWNQATTTTTGNTLTQQAWYAWQANSQPRWKDRQRVELTAEQRAKAAWEAQRNKLVFRNRQRAMELRRKFAERKAEALLLECLDDEQQRDWLASGAFTIEATSGRRYIIRRGRAGNVYQEGGPRYCMHVVDAVPNADNVLAQKLLLETDEGEFLRLANIA